MRIAVWGATGYGGIEAMRLLAARTDIEVVAVYSDSQAGRSVATVLPQFRGTSIGGLVFSKTEGAVPRIDAALLAMPHGEAHRVAPSLLASDVRVIDFSGDFRLPRGVYEAWYGRVAGVDPAAYAPVYGLPEAYREEIRTARLVANPGCYATCVGLALLPAAERGMLDGHAVMVDAKSGVSGAGRSPSIGTHFVEVQESVRAYKVGGHQHTPEIEQLLYETRRRRRREMDETDAPRILMTTQLLPIRRGIYVTAYIPLREELSADAAQSLYEERYADEPFVDILPYGQAPEIRHVTGTNQCQIGLHVDPRTHTLLVMATIDNLGKGAAGQALQNLNLLFGCEEAAGIAGRCWI